MNSDFSSRVLFKRSYDGKNGSLLTAGMGISGLRQQGLLPYVDQEKPNWEELRRNAIFSNYSALVPLDLGHDCDGWFVPNRSHAMIAGREYIGVCDDGSGRHNVTLLLQIPISFVPGQSGIIVAPSSGSRGVYGSIGTIGAWALTRGWAIVYLDKGTGIGLHDIDTNHIFTMDGVLADAAEAGVHSSFTAPMAHSERQNFINNFPHRIAFKHAHSQINQEKYWGVYTLEAVKYAFDVLNTLGIGYFNKDNTAVIAASISNGGKACLAAAEQDEEGLIKGVVVGEPNIAVPPMHLNIADAVSNKVVYAGENYSIIDYTSLQAIYQPCANLHPSMQSAPFNNNHADKKMAEARCQSLFEKGLLKTKTLSEQIEEARNIIRKYGILKEQEFLQPGMTHAQSHEAIIFTYANTYGRFSVLDRFADISYACVEKSKKNANFMQPIPLGKKILAEMFATSGGIFPAPPISLIYENALGGASELRSSISPSTGRQDLGLDALIEIRNLIIGWDIVEGKRLHGERLAFHSRIRDGQQETWLNGNLRTTPTIIVNGIADQMIAPNHASRAYVLLNKQVEGDNSNLSYIEVRHAQHIDSLLSLPHYSARFLPLIGYVHDALNWMAGHIINNIPLPPSQTMETIQRGMSKSGSVPPLSRGHMPYIAVTPNLPIYTDGQTLAVN